MFITTSDLIVNSFLFCKKNWRGLWIFALMLFLPALITSITGILSTFLIAYAPAASGFTNIIILAILVASGIFSVWATIALSVKIKNLLDNKADDTWRGLLTSTSQLIWPAIVASLLANIINFGPGLVLIIPAMVYSLPLLALFGMALFVFPGLMLFVWYSMSVYAVIFDGKTGWGALAQSKNLVIGRWWRIFLNLATIIFATLVWAYVLQFILSLPVNALVANEATSTIVQSLISSLVGAVIAPFGLAGMIMLYNSAKNNPVGATPTVPKI